MIECDGVESNNSFITKTAYDDLPDHSKYNEIFQMSNMSISKHLKRLVFKNGVYHVNPKFGSKKLIGSAYRTLKSLSKQYVMD